MSSPPASTTVDRPRRLAVAGLAVSILVAGVLTFAVARNGDVLHGFDQAVTEFIRSWADPLGWPVDVAHLIGLLTPPGWSSVAALVLALVLLRARHGAAAGFLTICAFLGVLVTEGTKRLIDRQRPPGAEAFESDLGESFPSGHSAVGIYLYLATGVVLIQLGRANDRAWQVRLGWVLVVLGPLIGVSRLVLGVHWPSDVIAGWAYGSAVTLVAALMLWEPLRRGWRTVPADPAP